MDDREEYPLQGEALSPFDRWLDRTVGPVGSLILASAAGLCAVIVLVVAITAAWSR